MKQDNKPIYKKVLLIDDNDVDCYITGRNIKKAGFASEVIVRESSEFALEYLESLASTPDELPEIIFLDILMPEHDGFHFLENYQKLPLAVIEKCVIIMLTSSLNPEDHDRSMKIKLVNKFINKPLTSDALRHLKDWLVEDFK
ncbi:MAG: response regulator [Bacteroidetes bacterium]|nr:response regulator [Bacteroidota bacterium]